MKPKNNSDENLEIEHKENQEIVSEESVSQFMGYDKPSNDVQWPYNQGNWTGD